MSRCWSSRWGQVGRAEQEHIVRCAFLRCTSCCDSWDQPLHRFFSFALAARTSLTCLRLPPCAAVEAGVRGPSRSVVQAYLGFKLGVWSYNRCVRCRWRLQLHDLARGWESTAGVHETLHVAAQPAGNCSPLAHPAGVSGVHCPATAPRLLPRVQGRARLGACSGALGCDSAVRRQLRHPGECRWGLRLGQGPQRRALGRDPPYGLPRRACAVVEPCATPWSDCRWPTASTREWR